MSKIYVDEILPKENAKIAAPDLQLPSGSVVQVVQGHKVNSNSLITSTSFVTCGLDVSITPTSATSKVKVTVCAMLDVNNSNNSGIYTLYRGDTELSGAQTDNGFGRVYSGSSRPIMPISLEFLDSPSTTSEITYVLRVRSTSGGTIEVPGGYQRLTITAMEIAQ